MQPNLSVRKLDPIGSFFFCFRGGEVLERVARARAWRLLLFSYYNYYNIIII